MLKLPEQQHEEMKNNTMELINLTPHTVTFVADDGQTLAVVAPSGQLARVAAKTVRVGMVGDIPVTATEYGEVQGLPAPAPGKIFIVSSLVAQRVPDRVDVFIPNESVRDSEGRIVGCKSLGHI